MKARPPKIIAYRRDGPLPRRIGLTAATRPASKNLLLIKGGIRKAGPRAKLTLVAKKAS